MDTKYIIGIVIVILIAGGAYFLFTRPSAVPAPQTQTASDAMTEPSPATEATTTGNPPQETTGGGSMAGGTSGSAAVMVVTYTDSGFSPASLSIAQGQTVTFVNKSSGQMWIASDPHPVHTGYDGTTEQVHCASGYTGPAPFDECGTANSFTFTFNKAGSWGYHNHFNASAHGMIVVTAGGGSSTK